MKERHLKSHLIRLSKQYPVVTLTGPRQSGKTTLCKMSFPKMKYVSLENPDKREYAITDPRGFLQEYRDGVIIDEIQKAPELPSYIQGIVDENNKNGLFILTGSQNLALTQTVSQSLAGRTATLTLLPFSTGEIEDVIQTKTIDELLVNGFYPRIYDHNLNPTEALQSYLDTYVDRDVRQLKNIHDIHLFHKFLKLCAGRAGQIVNLSALGNEVGISHTMVRQWLSILEATYIITLLPPYFKNFSKRVIKTPKLYFYDVGLASLLLGIHEPAQMSRDPLRGSLFENMVIIDFLKNRFNTSKPNDLYYFRDSKGNEVDLLLSHKGKLIPIEIKSASTFSPSFLKGIRYFEETSRDPLDKPVIIYGNNQMEKRSKVDIIPYKNIYQYYQKRFS